MVAINNYSVSLSLDAGNYIKNSSLSRSETNRLRRDLEKARTPTEQYQLAVKRLGAAWEAGAIDHKVYTRLVREAESQYKKTTAAAERALQVQKQLNYESYLKQTAGLRNTTSATQKYTATLSSMAAKLGLVAVAYGTLREAGGFLLDGVKLAAEAEQVGVAFRVMLKDAQLAAKTLNDLRNFAAKTPFTQQQIIKSGRSLLAMGFAADELNDRLEMLGNLAAGSGIAIEELAQIYGRFHTTGIIQAEELNQITDRGIGIYDTLAKQLGVATSEVKKLGSEGKITFDDIDKALRDLVNNDFAGLIEEQSKTMLGQWSTFNDEIARTKRLLGTAIADGPDSFLGQLTGVLDKMNTGLGFLFDPRGQGQRDKDAIIGGLGDLLGGAAGQIVGKLGPKQQSSAQIANRFMAGSITSAFQDFVNTGAGSMGRSAGMAGQGLMAGFQQLGTTIAGSFKFHTEKLAKIIDTSLVPSMEKGSAEAAAAILKAQNQQLNMEQQKDRQKEERERKSLVAQEKSAGYLESMLELWRNEPPIARIR